MRELKFVDLDLFEAVAAPGDPRPDTRPLHHRWEADFGALAAALRAQLG